MAEHIILLAGPMGAGKTTAVRSLSDIDSVSTEAANTERDQVDKPTTTVALDYGEITVGAEEKLRLYGMPGQRRFDFMWSILQERAHGVLVLIGGDSSDALGEVVTWVDEFATLRERGAMVVVLTRTDLAGSPSVPQVSSELSRLRPGALIPVLSADTRDRRALETVLTVLVANIEMRQMLANHAPEVVR